jgi:hypothetical protein
MTSVKKRQIRTLSQVSDRKSTEPHRIFMKISLLEMEKARRQKERQKAMQRVQTIDEKIQDIDAEIKELLSVLNLPTTAASTQQSVKSDRQQSQGQKLVLKY